jgi:isoquinoline 1-oxidoreductase beta subunit
VKIERIPRAARLSTVRKALLGHNPRALAVLTHAAEKAGWGPATTATAGPRRLGSVRLR